MRHVKSVQWQPSLVIMADVEQVWHASSWNNANIPSLEWDILVKAAATWPIHVNAQRPFTQRYKQCFYRSAEKVHFRRCDGLNQFERCFIQSNWKCVLTRTWKCHYISRIMRFEILQRIYSHGNKRWPLILSASM